NASGIVISADPGSGGNRRIQAPTIHNVGTISPQTLLTLEGNLVNDGRLDPGGSNTIGCVDVTGNFTQLGGGAIWAKISGPGGACVGHDQLRVTGAATLDGRLDVTLLN